MNLGGKMAENFDLETVAMTLIGHESDTKSIAYKTLYLMGAILFKDLVKEFIDLYKTVYDKK